MSETNQRQFDWGPPAGSGDGFKEWLIYFFILALLGVGGWVLLDINGRNATSPEKLVVTEAPVRVQETAPVAMTPTRTHGSEPMASFFVQLGAFADEESAREIYAQLVEDGLSPRLAGPDDQYEIYRVLLGPFQSEEEAENKAEQLNSIGLHCFVSESP